MSAWATQVPSQVAKYGKEKASWYCKWDEPDGTRRMKSCGPGKKGKRDADRMADHIKAEILTGTYSRTAEVKWRDFRKRYEANVVSGLSLLSRETIVQSLKQFETVLKLSEKSLAAITPDRLADFVAQRRKMAGKKPGSSLSPATINRDLRHVKAALRVACEWGYIERVPKIRFERELRTLPRYVTPEHFALIYKACEMATSPTEPHVDPIAWWRGLLVFAQMTGWRISEITHLEWSDVDLEAGTAITRERQQGEARRNRGVAPDRRRSLASAQGISIECVQVGWRAEAAARPVPRDPGRGRGVSCLQGPTAAQLHGCLLSVRFSRSSPCVRHNERGQHDPRGAPGPHAAPQQLDDRALHQFRPPNEPSGCESPRSRRAQVECGLVSPKVRIGWEQRAS
jgi:hypothetical protein